MIRVTDPSVLMSKKHLLSVSVGFDESLAMEPNVILQDGEDVALFEYEAPGVYVGHYLFESRGKKAIAVARQMLAELNADVIIGFTPIDNLGALWMTRHLGFKSRGYFDHPEVGRLEVFELRKNK